MSVEIIIDDCRTALRRMPDESVHCVVTSPPYLGLRDYGMDGQIGLEASVAEHLDTLRDVFREVRRVLRKDGTLWLNYGDAYSSGKTRRADTGQADLARRAAAYEIGRGPGEGAARFTQRKPTDGLKPKDLIGLPWRLAFALQADGWWLRSDIVWHKPNPMPESVTDRPTRAHEYVFLMSKAAQYWYDANVIKEPAKYVGLANQDASGFKNPQSFNGKHKGGYRSSGPDKQRGHGRRHDGFNDRWDAMSKAEQKSMVASARSVWTIATAPFTDVHFATFPPALAERCIKAGCPVGGTVLDPFGGAGTTGLVADRLQRRAVLIEINADYAAMARRRIEKDAGMMARVHVA